VSRGSEFLRYNHWESAESGNANNPKKNYKALVAGKYYRPLIGGGDL
jgi:hypothetical protein